MSGRPSWKSAEIGLFRPFPAFFALFRRVRRAPGKSRKRRKKAFFLRYPQICLNPHLLNPHLRHPNSLVSRDIPNFSAPAPSRGRPPPHRGCPDPTVWVWVPFSCLISCPPYVLHPPWGVAKGSSVSWVAKFKGDKDSECKLSNGWSRSYKVIKLLLSAGKCSLWSRSYREINQHPSLPWNFITHRFLDPIRVS